MFPAGADIIRPYIFFKLYKKFNKVLKAIFVNDLSDLQRNITNSRNPEFCETLQAARENQVAADLAKLRLFAGLTVDEASESLGVSRRTGFRHWTYARAFLQIEI